MQVITEKIIKQRSVAQQLRDLAINEEVLCVPLEKSASIYGTITRLKLVDKMDFITQKDGEVIKVQRTA